MPMTTKDAKQPLVLIVDDDESIRQAERRISRSWLPRDRGQ